MDLNQFTSPLPNGITPRHLELHNLSVRESRPIIEFEYGTTDLILTVFGREREGLLADLTAYLKSTELNVTQASIYTLPNGAIMDQFKLADPNNILEDDETLKRIHDHLVEMINSTTSKPPISQRQNPQSHTTSLVSSSQSNDSLYNYALLGHRVPISLLTPRDVPRMVPRNLSNIALTELEEEQRIEKEKERQQRETLTANFVDQHAISSLIEGEYLYYYSSGTRYRNRFHVSEDKTHLCWGESSAVRLGRYAGVLFGPKSATFQDLGPRFVDPEWLCFSLISNPPPPQPPSSKVYRVQTLDLVCVSVDQLNRWLLGLQSLCRPRSPQTALKLTLDDLVRMRVIYKIRAHAHARGLTVRRYVLKRVQGAGRRQSSIAAHLQQQDEVKHLAAELARLQKKLIDSARRETLLNSSLRDFQHSWEIDYANVEFLHPIGQGAFSEMWKGIWRSTPVAVKKLTTQSGQTGPSPPVTARRAVSAMTSMDDASPDARKQGAPSGDQIAMVQYRKSSDLSPEDRRLLHDFRLEVTMLSKLRHPNVVLFLGACSKLPRMCILTEFCHGGSLFAALRKRSWRTNLSLQDLRNVARHIAQGMRYLHACRIIHRDLKSQNLLLDRPVEEGCPVVKVADFGLSRNFSGIGTVTGSVAGIMTSETGTYRWMAPEMIRHEPYNEKVDVYSYGVVLWELFSCEVPFSGMTPIQAAFAVADKHLRPMCESSYAREVQIPKSWAALISQCWHPSSHERPRFSQVLKVLDEMDHTHEDIVPKLLRVFKRPDRQSGFTSPRASILHSIIPSRAVPSSEQSVDDGILEDMSKLELNESIEGKAVRSTRKTGLGHSGSAPNLSQLK